MNFYFPFCGYKCFIVQLLCYDSGQFLTSDENKTREEDKGRGGYGARGKFWEEGAYMQMWGLKKTTLYFSIRQAPATKGKGIFSFSLLRS